MAALKRENVGIYICERCASRFLCFTNRETAPDGLCNWSRNYESNLNKLDYETVKAIHKAKAKGQGRYYPTKRAE